MSESVAPSVAGVFRCPLCGSEYFATDNQRATGHCKGLLLKRGNFHDYSGCTFTWPRANDAFYFDRCVCLTRVDRPGVEGPRPGDVGLCFDCGRILQYDHGMRPRSAPLDAVTEELLALQREILAGVSR